MGSFCVCAFVSDLRCVRSCFSFFLFRSEHCIQNDGRCCALSSERWVQNIIMLYSGYFSVRCYYILLLLFWYFLWRFSAQDTEYRIQNIIRTHHATILNFGENRVNQKFKQQHNFFKLHYYIGKNRTRTHEYKVLFCFPFFISTFNFRNNRTLRIRFVSFSAPICYLLFSAQSKNQWKLRW